MKLNEFSATALARMLSDGHISNRDIMLAVLDRIDQVESDVCAFLTLRERVDLLTEADAIDRRRLRGEQIGPLEGLPVAIKDNICTKGLRTTCASRMLDTFIPPYDATVVTHIRRADGIVLGKTNMDEFAMGSSTENSAFKVTHNPRDLSYVPGGTSGGSAAAVAANETILAIASDTGGSIRQPASYCGVVGLKPTYGRVSRSGLIAYASSLDQIGTLTKTVSDARLLYSVIAQHDRMDTTSIPSAISPPEDNAALRTRTIGLPKEYFVPGVDNEVLACAQRMMTALQKLGHTTIDVSLPHTPYATPAYYIISSAEMSSNLGRYDGTRYGFQAPHYSTLRDLIALTRSSGFGAEVRRRILLGTYVLSAGYYDAFYDKAMRARTLICRDFAQAFTECDLIMTPVAPTPAFKIGEKTSDPLTMYLVDIFSVTANLAGLPAISVPFGTSSHGLPLSMQFIAPKLGEDALFSVASQLLGEERS